MKQVPLLIVSTVLVAACGSPEPRTRTVAEFVEDPALLQGVMIRCGDRAKAARDPECANAFAASERIAADEEARRSADRRAEFERQREALRAQEEQKRRALEQATPKFDPYSSPVAVDAADGATPPAAGTTPGNPKP